MLSFSVSTRNAEINDVSCWMSIINQNSFANLLRKTTLTCSPRKRHAESAKMRTFVTVILFCIYEHGI